MILDYLKHCIYNNKIDTVLALLAYNENGFLYPRFCIKAIENTPKFISNIVVPACKSRNFELVKKMLARGADGKFIYIQSIDVSALRPQVYECGDAAIIDFINGSMLFGRVSSMDATEAIDCLIALCISGNATAANAFYLNILYLERTLIIRNVSKILIGNLSKILAAACNSGSIDLVKMILEAPQRVEHLASGDYLPQVLHQTLMCGEEMVAVTIAEQLLAKASSSTVSEPNKRKYLEKVRLISAYIEKNKNLYMTFRLGLACKRKDHRQVEVMLAMPEYRMAISNHPDALDTLCADAGKSGDIIIINKIFDLAKAIIPADILDIKMQELYRTVIRNLTEGDYPETIKLLLEQYPNILRIALAYPQDSSIVLRNICNFNFSTINILIKTLATRDRDWTYAIDSMLFEVASLFSLAKFELIPTDMFELIETLPNIYKDDLRDFFPRLHQYLYSSEAFYLAAVRPKIKGRLQIASESPPIQIICDYLGSRVDVPGTTATEAASAARAAPRRRLQ